MSTQHPDNVTIPFFSESSVLKGDEEIREAYYVFSHLNCHEQMWDHEGKEVDNYVVKKLLSRYEHFFRDKYLGRDFFITLRVPNPTYEKAEAKILLETLESIPRSFDASKEFYGEDIAPIFEVIFPMTTSHIELNRIFYYYKNFVIGKQNKTFFHGDVTIADWIGEFKPHEINVIPLIEDMPYMLNCDRIVRAYLEDKYLDYQRVFLAKSDLSLNYGVISSSLALKIALSRLEKLEDEISTEIYPIVGFGSAPFRGNLRPDNVDEILEEWANVQTFTIQSAFKYDFLENDVRSAIEIINNFSRKSRLVEEEQLMPIIRKCSEEYRRFALTLAGLISEISQYIPKRRERKLHIGLFGYSRDLNGMKLPRAIPFCASLYSIGLPPELFEVFSLDSKEREVILENYDYEREVAEALRYFNPDSLKLIPEKLAERIKIDELDIDYEVDENHNSITSDIIKNLGKGERSVIEEKVIQCAYLRRFLG
jgi:phosphoenolpyruvate carboxylase